LKILQARKRIRRRTFRRLKASAAATGLHHYVYVVLLDSRVLKLRKIRETNPHRDKTMPCVYVGMSGLHPTQRFNNHKSGIKAARVVRQYGIRLLPELYEVFNPMPFEAAAQMERELAEDLRAQGYTVAGGH
jgi:hypothetical protein